MDRAKQEALEEAGFRLGDAEDFLDLTDEERALVELRVGVSRAIRQLRGKLHLSQKQLAVKLGSSQSRVAKMEAATRDVSLDMLFRGLFALGGKLSDLAPSVRAASLGNKRARRIERAKAIESKKMPRKKLPLS